MSTRSNASTPEPLDDQEPAAASDAASVSTEGAGAQASADSVIDERILTAAQAASDKKAHDLTLLDLRSVASFTDCFLLASAGNQRQVQAIADEVSERLKKQGTRAARIEGYQTAEWVLLDYGDFIIHVFEEKARRFYDLERLWRDAARVPLPAEVTGTAEGSAGAGGSSRTEP